MTNPTRELTIWAAQGPGGEIIRSSISTYRSDALKWKIKKKNYDIIKLGSLTGHIVNSAQAGSVDPVANKETPVLTPIQAAPMKRRPGRPRSTPLQAESAETVAPMKRRPGRPLGSKNKQRKSA